MKRIIQTIVISIGLSLGTAIQIVAQALDYHWIGQGDVEKWNDVSNWKTRATGSSDAFAYPAPNPPTEIDNVIFDDESFLITEYIQLDATDAKCATMDWRNATNNPTFGGTGTISIYGSLYLIDQMQLTFGGTILFKSNTADNRVIQSGNKLIRSSVEFDGDGSWTIDGSLSVLEDVRIKKGNVILGDQTIRLNKSWLVEADGAFTSGSNGTVIFEGSTDSRIVIENSSSEFNNLIIDKTVSINTIPNVTNFSEVKIKKNLTIENGELKDGGYQINKTPYTNTGTVIVKDTGILSLGDGTAINGFTVFPSFTSRSLTANSTVDYRDRATGQTVFNTIYGNLKLSNGAPNISPQTTKLLTGATAVNGNLTIATDVNLIDNGYILTGNNTSGKTLTLEGNATFTLGTNTTATALPTFNAYNLSTTSTVNYNAGVNQTIKSLNGSGNGSYGNLTLTNATATNRTKTLGGDINIRGNLNIGTNNTLDVSSTNNTNNIREISIQGNWAGTGGFTARTGTVNFNGTANQDLTTAATNHQFYNLRINTASAGTAGITLLSKVNISNTVYFDSGLIRSGINKELVFPDYAGSTSPVMNAKNTSHVVGPVIKNGNDDFIFPIGDGTYYRALGLDKPGNNAIFRAIFYNQGPSSIAAPVGPATPSSTSNVVPGNANSKQLPLAGMVDQYEYWSLESISGPKNAKALVSWDAEYLNSKNASQDYLPLYTDLVVAAWNEGTRKWDNKGGFTHTGNQLKGTVTATEAVNNNLTIFTIGSVVTALPIELLYFKANLLNKQTQFSWATAKEVNNDYFTIEKSVDGIHFDVLVEVDGAGNSQEIRKYSALDASPYNGVTYYRLKQTDLDSKFVYSKTIAVHTNGTISNTFVYSPESHQVHIYYVQEGSQKGILTMHDSKGVQVWSKSISENATGTTQTVTLPVTASGLYIVTLQQENLVIVRKLIVP